MRAKSTRCPIFFGSRVGEPLPTVDVVAILPVLVEFYAVVATEPEGTRLRDMPEFMRKSQTALRRCLIWIDPNLNRPSKAIRLGRS